MFTADQQFVWDKLTTESFSEIEDHFFDRDGSWIDVLDGDFGEQWMRYAVLNGGIKTFAFLNQYGWNSATALYAKTPHDKTNFTLGAVMVLEGNLKKIQQLYEWGWLKGNERVTPSSQVHVHDFAILNGSVSVASWLIDQRAKNTHTKKQLFEALEKMNELAQQLYLSETLKFDEPLGQRYQIFIEHVLSTYTKCSPLEVLPVLIKMLENDPPNTSVLNSVFIQMLLHSPCAYEQPMQKVWENLLTSNPQLWFTFANEFSMEQIERQKIQMLAQGSAEGLGLGVIRKWLKNTKISNPDFFNRLSDVAQDLPTSQYMLNRHTAEVQQALEHTRLLLEVESKAQNAHTSIQRKI